MYLTLPFFSRLPFIMNNNMYAFLHNWIKIRTVLLSIDVNRSLILVLRSENAYKIVIFARLNVAATHFIGFVYCRSRGYLLCIVCIPVAFFVTVFCCNLRLLGQHVGSRG